MNTVLSIAMYMSVFAGVYFIAYTLSSIRVSVNKVSVKTLESINSCILILFIVSPLLLISTIRYNVGTDYIEYRNLFNLTVKTDLKTLSTIGKEIGYSVVILLSNHIFGTYQGLLLFSSILTVLPAAYAMHSFSRAHFSLELLIYCLILFPSSFNGMRQHIAVAFAFLSTILVYREKYIKALIPLIIGFFFHNSIVVMGIFYVLLILSKTKIKYKLLKTLFALMIAVLMLGSLLPLTAKIPFLSYYYYKFMDTYGQATPMLFITQIIFKLPLSFIMIVYYRPLIKKNKKNYALIAFAFMEYVFVLASYYIRWAIRMQYYSMIATPLIMCELNDLREVNKRNKSIINITIVLTYIARFIVIFGLARYDNVIPYTTILF